MPTYLIENTTHQHLKMLFELRKKIYSDSFHVTQENTYLELGFNLIANRQDTKTFMETNDSFCTGLCIIYPSQNSQEIFFGFFENSGTENAITQFFESLIKSCKKEGYIKLKGPVNGSTFLPYRFISESINNEPGFTGELIQRLDYHKAVMSCNPTQIIEYKSGLRTYFDNLIKISKPYLDKYVLKELDITTYTNIPIQTARNMYDASEKIFQNNWGYEPINFDVFCKRFFSHYNQNECKLHQGNTVINITIENNFVGFAYFQTNYDNALIVKTLALDPAFQKHGLGNACVAWIHLWAKENQINKCIYSFIQLDNRVKNMPHDDAVIFRYYAVYEFNLTSAIS
ncbi:MAG: GNAT family N-acetyltransferase [Bacteroidetes bacterium]|nr:GNAT family N-acetyltransferase [Bacteroidota bacterium]